MFFDAHAHLDMLEEKELNEAITNAKKENVAEIISCSTSFLSNKKNLELTQKFFEIKCAIGLYPLDAIELNELELDKAFYFFEANASKAIAIGEVGLDYKYSIKVEEQEKQQKIFLRFIELSKKHSKPLIIHSRFAQKKILQMLIEQKASKVLLHSFVDSISLMKKAVETGFFISVGLSVLYNEQIQKNIKEFPLENLLFETDSPMRFNGKKAYSEKIALIAKKVCELKKIPLEEVEKQIEKNYKKLFY